MALYRKYRPATFAEVVGQEHVTDPLSIALDTGRISHAYLFSGPRGCGKTSSARILARSLNCVQGPTSTPCGVCPSCVALGPGGPGNLDVTELDAASHGGVDDTRELRDRAFYAPAESRYRVFIVDEAHMVTTAGFNALLKIVEEPPAHLIFIFATTEPDKVLPTIRSRTHHYPFRLLPPATMRGLLGGICEQEHVPVEEAVYPLVIRAGGGSPRDSLSVLDQLLAGAGPEGVTYSRAVSLLGVTDVALIDDAVEALATEDGAALFGTVDRVMEAGHDPRRFAADLLDRFRDLILLRAVPDATERALVTGPGDVLDRMRDQAERLGPATLTRYAELLHEGLGEMRGATSPRLLLEVVCARMLLPSVSDAESATLQRLERLERGLASGSFAAPTGSPASAGSAAPVPRADTDDSPSDPPRRRGAEALASIRRESRGGNPPVGAGSGAGATATDNETGASASAAAAGKPLGTADRSTPIGGGDPVVGGVPSSGAGLADAGSAYADPASAAAAASIAAGAAPSAGGSSAAGAGSVGGASGIPGDNPGREEARSGPGDESGSPLARADSDPNRGADERSSAAPDVSQGGSAGASTIRSAGGNLDVGASSSAAPEASQGGSAGASTRSAGGQDASVEAGTMPLAPSSSVDAGALADADADADAEDRSGSAAPESASSRRAFADRDSETPAAQSVSAPDAVYASAKATREELTGTSDAGAADVPRTDAESADSAARPVSAVHSGDLLREVEASWAEIRAKVREFGAAVQAMLAGASVSRIDGAVIVFAHQHAPLAQRLSDARNLEAVRSAVRAVLGRDYEVRWEAGGVTPRQAAAPRSGGAANRSRGSAGGQAAGRESGNATGRGSDGVAPPRFSRPSQAKNAGADKASAAGRSRPNRSDPRPYRGDDDIPPPDYPDLPDDPGPDDHPPFDATASTGGAVTSGGWDSDGVVPPATPEEEQEMMAAAADPVAPGDRRDPDEVALELLKTELGATRLDG